MILGRADLKTNKQTCKLEGNISEFPGGAAAKTQFSQRRGPRFDPWSVN